METLELASMAPKKPLRNIRAQVTLIFTLNQEGQYATCDREQTKFKTEVPHHNDDSMLSVLS